ncbi:MAG: glucan biosynthesis protein, partial [Candidatus Binatia bacterium]
TVVRGVVSVGGRTEVGEELIDQYVVKNPTTGAWRLSFQIKPKSGDPVDLRAFLQKGDDVLTETWSYTLRP